jgi:hypothetical protein
MAVRLAVMSADLAVMSAMFSDMSRMFLDMSPTPPKPSALCGGAMSGLFHRSTFTKEMK